MKTVRINKVNYRIDNFCLNCGHYHCEKNGKMGCIHSSVDCNCHKFIGRSLKRKFT